MQDVARRAGDAAGWLDQRDPGSLLEEARGFARRRPMAFLAVAAGLGVCIRRRRRLVVGAERRGYDHYDNGERSHSREGAGTRDEPLLHRDTSLHGLCK